MYDRVKFGKRLKEARKDRNLTQERLASCEFDGACDRTKIAKCEQGVCDTPPDILYEYHTKLHVDLNRLVCGDECRKSCDAPEGWDRLSSKNQYLIKELIKSLNK